MRMRTRNETDAQLRTALAMQIDWAPEIVSRDISVSVHRGEVTLTGFVHHYYEKAAAERAVKSVYGVTAVANEIEIAAPVARTDPEIARDVVHAMSVDATIPGEKIKVVVKGGFVWLEGSVDWNFQRVGAVASAERTAGVRGVINNIAIKPHPSPADLKLRIEDALRRSAEVDARHISVTVCDGMLTLAGNVRSWVEREAAERAAWAAPGVSTVVDHIAVTP